MVDRTHAEQIADKNETQSEKLNRMRKRKKLMNPTNQSIQTSTNEKRHVIDEGFSFNASSVESLLGGSSSGDRALNDTVENKRTAFKDEPLLELSKEERVMSDTIKENSHSETKKRKRKSKRKGGNSDELEPMDLEHKHLYVSNNEKNCITAEVGVDVVSLGEDAPKVGKSLMDIIKEKSQQWVKEKRCNSKILAGNKDAQVMRNQENKCLEISVDKSCISATETAIKDVDLTVESVLQESAEGEEILTEIVKEKQNPVVQKRRKKKSKTRNKDGEAILEEDKCLTISADSKSCIAAAESGIIGVGSVVEPVLQDSLRVEDEIVKEDKILGEKRKKKKKSKAMNKDGKAILEEDKCLTISSDSKSCTAAAESGINGVGSVVESGSQESLKVEEVSTEIVREDKILGGKRKKKKKSKAMNKDGNAILEEDKCLTISSDSKSCTAAAESGINGVGSVVESGSQESLKVEEVSTEIVREDKIPGGKRKKKSKAINKDGKAILEEDKCLLISADSKSCIAAAESGINGVGSVVESVLQESLKVEEVPTEIVKEDKIPGGERKRKKKSKARNKDVKVILSEDDKRLKISADRNSCGAAAESITTDVDLNAESLIQDSAVVDKASTEIVEEKKKAEGKKSRGRKSKSKNKVEMPILEQQDELLVTSIDEKCCTNTEMSTLEGVDFRRKCPSDAGSSPVSNGMVDLSNGLHQLPQRAVASRSRRILLVLDINGLLADIVMPPPKERKSSINMLGRAIFKRPYCDDFLNFCFDTFDVAIWSSRTKRVIDNVVEYLLGERRQKLLFCWDMSHTTVSRYKAPEHKYKPLVCKSLRNIWEKRDPSLPWEKGDYTESNTLLIDDSPYKALLNPMHTAIFPCSFTFKDLHDNSLGPGGEIREYLEELAKTDDVRKYVEQNPFGQPAITEKSPSWDFYSEVVQSLSPF